MKTERLIIALIFLTAMSGEKAISQTSSSGNRVGAFATQLISARSAGMGGVQVALIDGDASTAFWNPAALAWLTQRSISGSYSDMNSLDLVVKTYVAYSQPDRGYGAAGVYWQSIQTSVEGAGGIGEFNYDEHTFAYSYGKIVNKYISLGGSVKGLLVINDFENAGAWGLSFDFAALVVPVKTVSIGLVARNLLSTVRFETDTNDRLPVEPVFGVGFKVHPQVLVAGDIGLGEDSVFRSASFGVEAWVVPNILAGRAGYNHRAEGRDQAGLGIGARYNVAQFDYSFTVDENEGLGDTHRFTVSFWF